MKQEKGKKKKYVNAYFEQMRYFSQCMVDAYRFLGDEAKAVNKHIATKLAIKWCFPYSTTYGFVIARMNIAVLRAVHLYIWGS